MKENEEIRKICLKLVDIIGNGWCDESSIYDLVESYIGKDEIIRYKHKNGYELLDDEVDYLVSNLQKS